MSPEYPDVKLYIDGEWTGGAGGRGDDVINPATEEVLGRVPFAEAADIDAAIAAARAAFPTWRDAGPDFRSGILLKAAALLHQRADEIGRVMTLEEGKPLAEAVGEVHRAATGLQWNTEEGRRAYGRIIPSGPDEILSVRVTPVGPVGAFVPWNFPAGGPMRKISAALAAGCSIVIKPSEEVPGTVSLVAQAFADAGLPAGVLNVLFGVPDEISRRVIPDPAIRFIAFTGSVPVGKHLAGLAASAMKPAHMELGGHAPVIVCADTDPVKAARTAVRAKIVNAGQVCTSPSRFLVDRRVYEAFTEAFTGAMAAIKVGNGLEPGVQMGPMVSHRRLAAVQKLIEDAVSHGAKVATGGKAIDGPGFFYQPTVLTDVPADAALLHEEPFGPVAPIAAFDDLDEALEVANSLPFGLAAYAYTDSAATAEKLIAGYEAGILSINHCGGSVPQAPSGGFKESGYGREGGPEGLEGFLVTKRVSHKLSLGGDGGRPPGGRVMIWCRFDDVGQPCYGLVEDGIVTPVTGHPFGGWEKSGRRIPVSELRLLPPVIPSTFFCAGLNYRGHAQRAAYGGHIAGGTGGRPPGSPAEGTGPGGQEGREFPMPGGSPPGSPVPERPEVGYRANNALTGHLSPIVRPADCDEPLVAEGELVAVIGKPVRHATPEEAKDAIFGWTIGNDVSARGWQRSDRTFWRCKNSDTFKPMGPFIVTDADPLAAVTTVRVDHEVKASFATGDMLFGPYEYISAISRYITLSPGDVLWLGTDETATVVPGQVVEITIDGIGTLTNPVVEEKLT